MKGAVREVIMAGGHLDEASWGEFLVSAAAMGSAMMVLPTYPLCAPSVMAWGLMEMVAFLFDTTTAAMRLVLDGLYDRHPDFRFLVPHNGSFIPSVVGRIDMIAEARPGASGAIKVPPSAHIKKFYVDTVCGSTQSVRYCCDFFGVDHVMHGTDHPFF